MGNAVIKPDASAVLSPKEIYSFLPAAIEIEQTPASPAGRAILWSVMILFAIGVLWACFGHIDIVTTAQGKVIPNERVKQIQPLEAATIATIHVQDGQAVKAGDPLITLDGTQAEADLRRLTQEWQESRAQAQRHQAMADWLTSGRAQYTDYPHHDALPSALQNQHQRLFQQEAAEFRAKLTTLDTEALRLQAEIEMTEEETLKQSRILDVLKERVAALETLEKKKLGSRAQYLELKQELITVDQDVRVNTARLNQLDASVAANDAQRQSLVHEHHKNTLALLQEADTRSASLKEEQIKAQQRSDQYKLTAPIDGRVHQLAVHTLGGVVTPAQVLMEIVPEQSDMEVEAFVMNQDIGFVQEGQPAEVKIDTFNFTKYGIIDAELIRLSDDAVQDENLGLVYTAKLKLKQQGLSVNGKFVKLSPGMSVMAEVKTGQRRLIEYFLSPLLRYKEESVRER